MGNFSRRFNSMFKSHRKVWTQLAYDLGAEFVDKGIFKPFEVIKQGEGYNIKLDSFTKRRGNHSETITRFQTSCENPKNLQIRIARKALFNKKAPKGTENVITDFEAFDRKFWLSTSAWRDTKQLLHRRLLSDIMAQQPFNNIQIELKEKELELRIHSLVKDIDQLKSLFKLIEVLRLQFNSEQ